MPSRSKKRALIQTHKKGASVKCEEKEAFTSKTNTNLNVDWKPTTFPYLVDYNDHFETPLQAYVDILPILDLVAPSIGSREKHVLYDPYYCNGRTKRLLESSPLGFSNVQHEKRDFYQDIKNKAIPQHDSLVTNPPYSLDHKIKCLDFVVKSLRQSGRSFFLLLPNYIATKEYYRQAIYTTSESVRITAFFWLANHSPMVEPFAPKNITNVKLCVMSCFCPLRLYYSKGRKQRAKRYRIRRP
jgi:hypothetical protein